MSSQSNLSADEVCRKITMTKLFYRTEFLQGYHSQFGNGDVIELYSATVTTSAGSVQCLRPPIHRGLGFGVDVR